ncbi:hypothetical protein H257_05653 [Aphanomyces astaci]|uniref:RNase H type-1 domain-containing protein n=1 Tax=Aphanomyces astaci TaxID=112090 RepID=W4GNW1_APHAT|nr:hypothetical protein H257_05653 [Aphanomyces astaci]ETV81031.1 hypothetical protein H257_05653 [Aphanomyces astaci]|eukprot:XP_009828889.1 hypothetical protein H257_05653 [Aphanomyces astaci]
MDGVVFFHGASRLDAACEESGALVMPRDYPILCDYDAHYIPTATTNNQAEYDGLLRSLQLATIRGYIHLTVYGDSQLLVRQMQGICSARYSWPRAQYLQARRLDGPEYGPLPSRQLALLYDFLDLDLAFNPGQTPHHLPH